MKLVPLEKEVNLRFLWMLIRVRRKAGFILYNTMIVVSCLLVSTLSQYLYSCGRSIHDVFKPNRLAIFFKAVR